MKFGMSILVDEKTTRKKFNPIGSLLRRSSGTIGYLRICMAIMPSSWPIWMKFGMRIVLDENTTRKKFQPDCVTSSAIFGYLPVCMAFMPNSWPISLKFGISVLSDKKQLQEISTQSVHFFGYLRVCEGVMPIYWTSLMKFFRYIYCGWYSGKALGLTIVKPIFLLVSWKCPVYYGFLAFGGCG